jgi:hypothetical protein
MPDDKTKETKKDELDLSSNPQFKQLMSVVSALGKGIQATQASVQGLTESIGKMSAPQKQEEKKVTDDDINTMTQAELVQHMFGGVRKMLDGVTERISKQVDEVTEVSHRTALTMDINQFRGAHKDFDDWIPEIKEKINSVSGLSAQEAYTLVKAANPEKAKELDTKYASIDDVKGASKKGSFGGMRPGQHSEGKDGNLDENKQDMTRTEAADKAWEEAFGDNPVLAGEDNG